MRPDLFRRLDPRTRLAAFLAVQFLLFVPSIRPLPSRLFFVAAALLATLPWAGRAGRLFLRLMLMLVPFLAVLSVSAFLFPASGRNGGPLATVWPLLLKAMLVSLSLAVFIISEEPRRWLQASRQVRLPASAVVVLAIGYRFAGQWQMELEALRRALAGRNFRALPWLRRAKYLGSALPLFFERLFDGAVHVHDAMVSRGFRGVLPPGRRLAFSLGDVLFLFIVAAALAAGAWLS
jgi:energy-coupling factor transporter transmembrane protein EcfT